MTLSPASLSGRGLYLAKHLLLTAPDTPRKDISSHSLALPRPGEAPCLGEGIGAWRLREVRGSSWGQGHYSLSSLPQFPSASRYTPCQLGRSVGGTESCSTGLSSRTPAAGVVWKPHYRNKLSLSWVCVYSWGGAAAGLQGGTRGGGSYPTDQTGVKAWGPEPGGPRTGCPVPSPCCRDGGSGREQGQVEAGAE